MSTQAIKVTTRPALSVIVPLPARRRTSARPARLVVDLVVPVYNEERDLEPSIRRLHTFMCERFPFPTRITIANNASTDSTREIAERIAAELPNVRVLHLSEKGRGRALAAAWMTSDAYVVAYTDVDLSTDLSALLPLVAPIISGHSELSIGSRLAKGARVTRGAKRELLSRCYNLLLRIALGVRFRDAQCGFKAVRADVARKLVPTIVNRNWFFDTELLVRAERAGLRIHELPVDWTDDPDSRVEIVATAIEDLQGVWRLVTGRFASAPPRLTAQFVRFAVVGAASTLAYAALYWILRNFVAAVVSNSIALAVTSVANTAANRRFTFGVKGRRRLVHHHAGGLAAFGLALALTNGAILFLSTAAPSASRVIEIALLTAVNAAATLVRFLSLRMFLFHLTPQAVEPSR